MNILGSTSISSFWSGINQVQLFFLFFLTRAFIPIDIQNVITGGEFSLDIASYIKLSNLIDPIINNFDFNLNNQTLALFNIKSISTIYNLFPTIILALAMIPLHFAVVLIYKCTQNNESEGRCKYFKTKAKKILKKLPSLTLSSPL